MILNEFKDPRQEFELIIPLTYDNLTIDLLDRIKIDYAPLITEDPDLIPICGEAICGEAVTPSGLFNFILNEDQSFEIIQRRVNFRSNSISFDVRKVVP